MDNIFTTAKQDFIQHKDNEYYVYVGQEDFIDEHNYCRANKENDSVLAKKIYRDDGTQKLMIKCDMNNKPIDPDNQLNSSNRTVSSYRSGVKFVSVGQKAFEYYLKFLQTTNKSWLLNTERELI